MQWPQWGSKPRPLGLESSTLPLSYCTPEMLCNPEHNKPLRLDCFTEPHLDFAFMNKSFASMPRFYAQVICNWGFLINMCEQQRFVFFNKSLQKMVYRLNQTRDELHIHIYILGDKKNCSLRRCFWVPTTYVLVAAFKVRCKDISFIVLLFDLCRSCKRLQNSSHICNQGFIVLALKKAVSLRQHFWIEFNFSLQRYKLNSGIIYYNGRSLLYWFHFCVSNIKVLQWHHLLWWKKSIVWEIQRTRDSTCRNAV